MNIPEMRELILDIRGMETFEGDPSDVPAKTLAVVDRYDLRFLGKQEVRRMTLNEIEALLEYIQFYFKRYESGKFSFKRNRVGREVADFDEADVYKTIIGSTTLLKAELKRRL